MTCNLAHPHSIPSYRINWRALDINGPNGNLSVLPFPIWTGIGGTIDYFTQRSTSTRISDHLFWFLRSEPPLNHVDVVAATRVAASGR
jgi:hypothetical protein